MAREYPHEFVQDGASVECVCICGQGPETAVHTWQERRKCKCTGHDGTERWHGSPSGKQYHGCRCDRCVAGTIAYHAAYWKVRGRRQEARQFSCAECGTEFESVRARRYCGEECRAKADTRSIKASHDRKNARRDERKRRMWEAQGRCCAFCLKPLAWEDAELDHDHACCAAKKTSRTCGKCDRGVVHGNCNRLIAIADQAQQVLAQATGYRERVMRGLEALVP